MATAAAVERFRAQGKQQLNVWVDTDTAAILKMLSAQRSQSYGDVLRDALIALSGQPVATVGPVAHSSAIDAAAVDRLVSSVEGLNGEVALLGGNVRDYVETSDDRLSEIEARLQHLEATITRWQCQGLTSPQTSPETPVSAAPGANEAPGKRPYKRLSDSDRDKRNDLIIELHHKGLTPTKISRELPTLGFHIGVGISNIQEYLNEKGLTPHTDRKRK